jgi:hypothetical protein
VLAVKVGMRSGKDKSSHLCREFNERDLVTAWHLPVVSPGVV